MSRTWCIFLLAFPLFGQDPPANVADRMLARVRTIAWEAPYPAGPTRPGCDTALPIQLHVYATLQWSYHCADTAGGIVRESFFYVFGEPARTARLRVDLRPVNQTPEWNADLLQSLRQKLTRRFGPPDHQPELFEVGFRPLRFGQPVAGDHWKSGEVHYFLHANQAHQSPLGVRKGVQLLILHQRLMAERTKDSIIQQVDGLGSAVNNTDTAQARLESQLGSAFQQAVRAPTNALPQRTQSAQLVNRTLLALLREASSAAPERKAMLWIGADQLVIKASGLLIDSSPNGEHESLDAAGLRRQLARYRVTLGSMTHYGGLAYTNDLLWRTWKELPQTQGGELAFVFLQRRGWNTASDDGCPKNPDLFRDVIEKGEAFLAAHPQTRYRKEVVYSLAVANESWWSIAHAPADDPFVGAPPYPRRALNASQSPAARERAIAYYREVIRIAPDTAEALSAARRLPRLMLGLDTNQRSFYCSYC